MLKLSINCCKGGIIVIFIFSWLIMFVLWEIDRSLLKWKRDLIVIIDIGIVEG